jgi:hypothetical protein
VHHDRTARANRAFLAWLLLTSHNWTSERSP